MTRDALFQSPPATRDKRRVGEVAGGAAAECAAVCCCCPCSMMNLLILTVYKVPKGICRKAWAHTKKKRRCVAQKKGISGGSLFTDGGDTNRASSDIKDGGEDKTRDAKLEDELEKEMWDQFYSAGFWRSSSRRES